MTIMQLRCFIEVAHELNYAKAAANLYISQPAVSRHIVSLEADLGVRLFHRDKHNVSLTPAGLRFFSEAKDIIERIDLSKANIQYVVGEETLNVGCVSSIQIYGLSEIYRQYHQLLPDVMISNTEISALEYRKVSSADHLDVAFVPNAARANQYTDVSLRYQSLHKGKICCVMRKNHRLVGKKNVTLSDLTGETLILLDHEHCPAAMEEVQYDIRRNGKDIKYFYSGSSLYTVPMIIGGLGLAIMPDFVCPKSNDIVLRPFDFSANLEFGIIYRMNDMSEKVKSFVDITKKVYNQE